VNMPKLEGKLCNHFIFFVVVQIWQKRLWLFWRHITGENRKFWWALSRVVFKIGDKYIFCFGYSLHGILRKSSSHHQITLWEDWNPTIKDSAHWTECSCKPMI
jgi:hypothetical protein